MSSMAAAPTATLATGEAIGVSAAVAALLALLLLL
jgi:hypothetical protein